MKKKLNGYIIRDEEILKGTNATNALNQIVTEGARVSKGEAVFRYYTNNEDEIMEKIENINKEIDRALLEEENIEHSAELANLEHSIKNELDNMYTESNIQNIHEFQKRINGYMEKKGEIAGNLSPNGSYLRTLVEERTSLIDKLTRRF